jgi:inhibitor of KinA
VPTPPAPAPRAFPLGDAAVVVELGAEADVATSERVLDALARLEAAALPGVVELVPAYTTVALVYDLGALLDAGAPLAGAADWLGARALAALTGAPPVAERRAPREVEIPVLYGGAAGPDLPAVAQHAGLGEAEVVRRHAAAEYRVALLGFAPGFPYLLGLPRELATPRLATPRASVPAGSVGIAGAQTGVYPLATPGGWRIVGRTPLALFRPDEEPPVWLRVGDRVRFRAIEAAEFEALAAGQPARGASAGEVRP